jgi:hypothetical protein
MYLEGTLCTPLNVLKLLFLVAMGKIARGAQYLNTLLFKHTHFLLQYIFAAFHYNQRNVQYHPF